MLRERRLPHGLLRLDHFLHLSFNRLILNVLQQLLVSEIVGSDLISRVYVPNRSRLELSQLLDRCLSCELLFDLFKLTIRHLFILILL